MKLVFFVIISIHIVFFFRKKFLISMIYQFVTSNNLHISWGKVNLSPVLR